MKKHVFAGVLVLLMVPLAGCFSEPEARLEERVQRIEVLLEPSEKTLLDSGKYSLAAESLRKRLSENKELERRYRDVIQEENIGFFDVESVLRFYHGSMRARARLFRFIAMLADPEVTAFNERRFADLARSLQARFALESGLEDLYRKQTAPVLDPVRDDDIAREYALDSVVKPFAVVYSVMNPGERELLVTDKAGNAAGNLRVRMSADPALQGALTTIRVLLPETRSIEDPGRVFSIAAALAVTNREARQDLVKIADWISAASKTGRLVSKTSIGTAFPDEMTRLVNILPKPDVKTKRLILLEREISWFSLVVDEKINFYN